MKPINILIGIIILASAGIVYASVSKNNSIVNDVESNNSSDKMKAIVYKTPTCGCCTKYTSYLEDNGFEVETKMMNDLSSIKNKHGIASNMESCHTVEIGNYFVEGHVPMEAIKDMLTKQPEIDGIALPEMPTGSPGMPGIQREPFEIFSIKNGKATNYMSIE